MDRSRLAALLLLTVVPASVLLGCSSGGASSTSTNSATVSASPTPTATATTASPDPAGVGLASASAEIQAKIDCQIIRSDADKLDLGTLVAGLDLSSDQGAAALKALDDAKTAATAVVAKLGASAPASSQVYLAEFATLSAIIKDGFAKGQSPEQIQEALAAANTPGVQQLSSDLSAAVDAKCPPDASAYASGFGSGDPSTYVTN